MDTEIRQVLGKKVKALRRDGFLPGHIFGNKTAGENVTVKLRDFVKAYQKVGETGLLDLQIVGGQIKPVLIREIQVDPVKGSPLHIDFYQVNLSEKVKVAVPLVLVGDEPNTVKTGEAVVIQPMSELEVEALPDKLPEKVEVDISLLKAIGDAIAVSNLRLDSEVTVLTDSESVVVKLDNAITEEMKKLMEEQAAEQAAAAATQAPETAEAGTEAAETVVPAEEQPAAEVVPVSPSE